jgi:hypothetical protein
MSDVRKIIVSLNKDSQFSMPTNVGLETEGDVHSLDAIFALYGAIGNVTDVLLRTGVSVTWDTYSHVQHEQIMDVIAPVVANKLYESMQDTLNLIESIFKIVESKDEDKIREFAEEHSVEFAKNHIVVEEPEDG